MREYIKITIMDHIFEVLQKKLDPPLKLTVTLWVKDTKEIKSKERDWHVYCSVLGNKDVELI